MKINTTIPDGLKIHFNLELDKYRECLAKKDLSQAWHHLELAHILGQSYPFEHTLVHWYMLKFGIKIKSGKEIIGQIPRLLVGGVKSFVGKIPVGNTGGANVPALQPMEIPESITQLLEKYNQSHHDKQ